MSRYGLDRVIAPKEVFPASAWELDSSGELRPGEIKVRLKKVHVESTSFKQICQEAANDEDLIKERIKDIVIRRGKLHNPITDTGGLFCGVVEEISDEYDNKKGLEVGEEVICNSSLAGVPLYINSITAIDENYPQFEADGYAICLPGVPLVRKPAGLPVELLMFVFNESGPKETLINYDILS